jgi:hypothetical protein
VEAAGRALSALSGRVGPAAAAAAAAAGRQGSSHSAGRGGAAAAADAAAAVARAGTGLLASPAACAGGDTPADAPSGGDEPAATPGIERVALTAISNLHRCLGSASPNQLLDTSLFVAGGRIHAALCYEARSTGPPAEPPLFEAVVFAVLSKVCWCQQHSQIAVRWFTSPPCSARPCPWPACMPACLQVGKALADGASPASLRKGVDPVLLLLTEPGLAKSRERKAIPAELNDQLWEALVSFQAADGWLDGSATAGRLLPALPLASGIAFFCWRGWSENATPIPCHALQEPFPGAPAFRIEEWGLVVARGARPGSPCYSNIDHRVPLSKGGRDTLENLAIVHSKLNNWKRDRWDAVAAGSGRFAAPKPAQAVGWAQKCSDSKASSVARSKRPSPAVTHMRCLPTCLCCTGCCSRSCMGRSCGHG